MGTFSTMYGYYSDSSSDNSSKVTLPDGTTVCYNPCGPGDSMQINIQRTLNPTIQLLAKTEPGEPGYDPRLAELADWMNAKFQEKASKILLDRRQELAAAEFPRADRLEVTLLLTARGLQLAFDLADERKQVPKVPRKPLLRRWFGWALPKRYWTMPQTDDGSGGSGGSGGGSGSPTTTATRAPTVTVVAPAKSAAKQAVKGAKKTVAAR